MDIITQQTLKKNQFLTDTKKRIKRGFDVIFSIAALLFLGIIIILFIIISRIVFKESGLFLQERIGIKGQPFIIYKIKSISKKPINKKIVFRYSHFIRRTKLDELPQFYNVLIGDMSVVGPRPDIKGFADQLIGEDRIILTVKPGITGPATIYFKNEDQLLAHKKKPEQYNLEVIWPKKIEINKIYVSEYSFFKDLYYIYKTFF